VAVDRYRVCLTRGPGAAKPLDSDRAVGSGCGSAVDLVHGSIVDGSKGYAPI
jgi:hypothetical protein